VVGAAVAWAARGLIDLSVMLVLACRRLPAMASRMRRIGISFGATFLVLGAMVFLPDDGTGMAVGSVILACFVPTAWFGLLGAREKELLGGLLSRFAPKP
jgi:hypothetical protein